ncbi:MAG: FAD-dependent oxidoreductase [Dehalococcoidales bacterium]|jgi:fumarate reductase flavoprotein subunit
MSQSKSNATQLLIIGGGGAGLAAAVEAFEKGIHDITVVEKRRALGGVSAIAGGIFACESPVQKRLGIVANPDKLFKKAMDWAHWSNLNPPVLRAFIDKSGDTIKWLEAKGLVFDLITFYPGQDPPVQHNPRGFGAALVKTLENECKKYGVNILRNSAAQKIVRAKNGAVKGVEVFREGALNKISCGSVIIATGGFAGNRELMQRYFPSLKDGLVLSGLPLEGDGIRLAEKAGASIADIATIIKEGPRVHKHLWPLMALERNGMTLWVNKRGERFTDESTGYHIFESVNAVIRQPEMACFILMDSAVRRYFEERGNKLRRPSGGNSPADIHRELEKGIQDGVSKGTIKIADSWEEIAAWLGAEKQTLRETVNRYNEYCKNGYDAAFLKDREYLLPLTEPPFYAIKTVACLLDTIGGINIDEKMRVVDKANKAIPGLYAAGVVTSGWESEIYCSELSASAFGFAVNSGRIAAGSAAGYLLSGSTSA